MGIKKMPFYNDNGHQQNFDQHRHVLKKKKCFLEYSNQFDSILLDGQKFWSKNVVKCTSELLESIRLNRPNSLQSFIADSRFLIFSLYFDPL